MKKCTIKQSRWLVSMLALLISTGVHAEVFKGLPDTIVCNLGQGVNSPGQLVFYLEGRDKNGISYYKSFVKGGRFIFSSIERLENKSASFSCT